MEYNSRRINYGFDTGLALATSVRLHSPDGFSEKHFLIIAVVSGEFLITDQVTNLSRN
jgi:hypothetical protein